jgi:hypothetical protein
MAAFRHNERRRSARLSEPFPVFIRGVDAIGRAFEYNTVLDNVSADGFYMRLGRYLAPGTKLFAVVRLTTSSDPGVSAPRLAARSIVVRAEPQSDGRWGLGVQFTHHRFL